MAADHGPHELDFSVWFSGAWAPLVRALTAFSGDQDAATEAAAEACARALNRWGNDVGSMENPTGWAFAVGRDVLRKQWKRRRRQTPDVPAPLQNRQDSSTLDERLVVIEALRRVPWRQRQALVLRYLLDMSQDEVAQVMGIAPGSAAAILHTARASLRAALPDTTGVEP